MRKRGLAALTLTLLAVPAAAYGETVATGHIVAGTPHTSFVSAAEVGVDGVDGFFFDAPAAGTVITTRTVDRSELGYDLDFYFFDASGDYVDSECQTEAANEVCTVPEGAVDAEVAAYFGADLDVTVLTVP